MPSKEIKQLLEQLRQQGWRVTMTKKGHYWAYPPDRAGSAVLLPSTPSDQRSLQNAIAMLRRNGFIWKGR